jgi:hypothetical protein
LGENVSAVVPISEHQRINAETGSTLAITAGIDPMARRDPATFDQSIELFRKDMRRLIAEFGQAAVDAALDEIPDGSWPSTSLH